MRAAAESEALVSTDLAVGGMTCAACVSRVEKRLARIEGVSAGVNLATGRARVLHPAGVGLEELVAAVERAGYTAELAPEGVPSGGPAAEEAGERWRLLVMALLAVPVLVL
ncbi:heavy metal-associated domain-containing protein, partial [Streptomyces sp. NRRL S-495]|uniref:cation transporter n=1 Tax=Streptomyces sp. NRRL S-495 TaxID=1609133 RepID=UPI0005F93627